ncbi:MAG: hypothetical protein IJS89_00580 [Bacteroidaceae bacterium]|nr:hypothetical protein [Bacteroidaceae bacterium]
MNKTAAFILSSFLFLFFSACSSNEAVPAPSATSQPTAAENSASAARTAEESAAQALLDTARLALQAGGFETARTKALGIRKQYPQALNAREDAILLLDSIEMFEAAARVARLDATGSVETDEAIAVERAKAADKVEFFQQKLAHDIAARKTH